MDVMRYTVVQQGGGISFVADCQLLSALVAACGANPGGYEDLLGGVDRYDKRLRDYVLNSLAIFDEHNAEGHYEAIHQVLAETRPANVPVFRIVDDVTRQASLQPVRSGVIIFNLKDHRIVQVQNTYQDIVRSGKIRLHDGKAWTRRVERYELPTHWSIVP
ncbi:MAG: hypothetical protein NVSMB65_09950 [Chloroflexota bacterium]